MGFRVYKQQPSSLFRRLHYSFKEGWWEGNRVPSAVVQEHTLPTRYRGSLTLISLRDIGFRVSGTRWKQREAPAARQCERAFRVWGLERRDLGLGDGVADFP